MNKAKKSKRIRVDVSMFGESSGNADVKLVVEGTSIPVIKAVLGVASPVFMAMFERDFKENNQNEIKLPGKKLDDVLTLLKCIYPNILLTVTGSVAFAVLPLSDEYQMLSLKTKCEDVLLQTLHRKFEEFYMKDCAYLYKFLSVSVKFSLQRLQQHCVLLAADFKQKERKTATLGQNISADVIKQIDELAISRLEVKVDDVKGMVSDESLNRFFNTYPYYNAENVSSHLRGLRLAYLYGQSKDRQLSTVLAIRQDKRGVHWRHDEEYKLLPESIKRAIEFRPTQNVE